MRISSLPISVTAANRNDISPLRRGYYSTLMRANTSAVSIPINLLLRWNRDERSGEGPKASSALRSSGT
ncbi:unnamed protein product, partial [Brenthis ino]